MSTENSNNHELLARVDERTKAMQSDMNGMRADIKSSLDNHSSRIGDVEKANQARFKEFEDKFVTNEEFSPIQKLVYGFVTVVILAVIGALLSTVIK